MLNFMAKFWKNLKILYIFIYFIIFVSFTGIAYTQFSPLHKKGAEQKQQSEMPKTIFGKIEEGIAIGDVDKFSSMLSSRTYLSLSNGVTGYYSSNQAFYILQDFFRINKPVSFRFLSMNEKADNPFATGFFKYESKGVRGNAQVYITLIQIGNNWKISLITIN